MSFDDAFKATHAARAAQMDPPFVKASTLAGKAVPERRWIVPEWIPDRTVTLFGGDGGTGKSLVALQLGVAVVMGAPWLGLATSTGPVIFVSAEDDMDELHRRLAGIAAQSGLALGQLDRLTIRSMAGWNALLAMEAEGGTLAKAQALDELAQMAAQECPALIVLDTLADFYPSNENDRAKVRAFIGILRGFALRHGCAVLLLAHPSLTGMNSGSGLSGSTAWNNSVRSRIYLERITEEGIEPDPNARRLSVKKANYGATGLEIALRWQDGVFMAQAGPSGLDRMAANAKAERVFLKLLDEFTAQGRPVKSATAAGYAPKAFAASGRAEGLTKHQLHGAMERLFGKGEIVEVLGGSGAPSKQTKRIVRGG